MSAWDSPFIVPMGAFAVAVAAIVGGAWRAVQKMRLKGSQRLALLERGLSLAEVEAVLSKPEEDEMQDAADPLRRSRAMRITAMVLISSGLGLVLFFVALRVILHEPEVLSGAAVGLIPLLIGLGFLIEYGMQKRELNRFGLDAGQGLGE